MPLCHRILACYHGGLETVAVFHNFEVAA
jgi:hypothetical protein